MNINKITKVHLLISLLITSLIFISCSSEDTEPLDKTAPTIPVNVSATNTTQTKTDLSWSASVDNVGVKEYLIYKDAVQLSTSTITSYTTTNLSSSTAYTFKVKAKDAAGNESGFSSIIDVTTASDNPTLVVAFGDIESYVGNLIDKVPSGSGDDYKVPSTNQIDTWNLIINAVLSDNIPEAVTKSFELNYQITEFTDTSLIPNQVFYILEERSNQINYWGTYLFNKTPRISNLILMAPHIKNDTNTGNQAVYCFKKNLARALFINGTHRCNSNSYSSCSGTTSTCNSSSEPYRVSDLAHNTNSVFQKTTEILFNNIVNSVFIQLHGFGNPPTDPYVIMSNGTQLTPTTDYATLLKEALLVEDNTLTFKIAHIDTDWTRLRGFSNTQGRLINNSNDYCLSDATTTSGRFIHIEQEKTKLREDASKWIKMSNALGNVFN